MSASSPAIGRRVAASEARRMALAVPLALLAAAVLLLWLVLRAAPPLALDVGADGDGRFLSGFYLPEQGGERSFRWSGPEARLMLHGASPGPAVLRLQLNGERLATLDSPELTLARAELSLARFAVGDGWRDYRILLPPGGLATPAGSALPLDLRSALSRPGQTSDDIDLRPLGVPLAEVSLAALPPGNTAALARALWLGWLLATLTAAAAWLDAATRPRQRATLWRRAALLLGLGGAALTLWAWRDPYGLAWALPPLPWALGTATLLLAVLTAGLGRGKATRAAPSHTVAGLGGVWGGLRPPQGKSTTRQTWSDGVLASPWPLLGGLALLALASGLLATQVPLAVGAGIALAVVALLLLSAGPHGLGVQLWVPAGPDLARGRALLLLALIFLLALGLRLFRLDELPFGLWRDEARHGIFAQLIRDYAGYRPIYIASDRVNMPALGLYPFAVALQLWGEQLWSMRIVTGLAGALTVLPLYALTSMLSGRRAVGLLAALLLAASSWHISVSRLAFPTVFDPLLALSGLALLLWALGGAQSPTDNRLLTTGARLLAGLAAGVCLGLAVQTYHTGRVAPVVAGWLGLLLLLRNPRGWRGWLPGGLAAALGLALTLGPLVGYALARPDAFNDRVGDVFLLSPQVLRGQAPLAALDETLRLHLLMFHVAGDENGRHHAPGRPLLDYVSGLGLLLGLAALLRRPGDWRVLFLLGALAIGLLPSALAMNAPHGLRAFAALAFAYIIAALGWAALWRSLRVRAPTLRLAPARLAAGVLLSLAVALNAWLYFVIMPPQPEVFLGFYPVQSRMGAYVRELAAQGDPPPQVFVPAGLLSDPVFVFLTTGLPVQTFAGDQLSAPAQPGAIFLLSGYFVEKEAAGLAPVLGPEAEPVALGPMFPDGSRRTFYVYRLDR